MNEKSSKNHQSLGGRARAESLTKQQRAAIASTAAKAMWEKKRALQSPDRIPLALYQGDLVIGAQSIDCYVLDNQKRVIHKRGMAKALSLKSTGGNAFLKTMGRKSLGSNLPDSIWEKINNPLIFKPLSGDPGHGYECTVLIDICVALSEAYRNGKLHPSQAFLGLQAETIIRAAAKLGIVALVDEATGYIADKRKEEYRELFRDFIRDEFRQYKSEFPDQFFDMIYGLYSLPRIKGSKKHPQFFGRFIRRYIYEPLASSNGAILEMLDEKNPVVYVNGGRRYKMFQFLSDVVGMNALRSHIWQVVGIGNSVKTRASFERAFLNAFPALDREPMLPDFEDPI
jgi:hypothetical protein